MVYNNTNNITNLLGEPKRYAYKAQPVTLYVAQETGMKSVKCYSVDFEKACDMFSIDDARSKNYVHNPHLINIIEHKSSKNVDEPDVLHSILLDKVHYDRLLSFTNSDGNLRRYNGVVEGHEFKDVKDKLNDCDLIDTGLCLSEKILHAGGLRRPTQCFDEKKHTRFVQASESYRIKSQKRLKPSVMKRRESNIYIDYSVNNINRGFSL